MSNPLLEAALQYHDEGLNVIPVIERDKRPALQSWDEYHSRRSTEDEIRRWWGNGHNYNIGLVHMDGFVTLDIDHDSGLVDEMFNAHPHLFKGRIEQSGSGEGYHVPLRLDQLPDFGTDQKQNRPRGNRTWKTKQGHCNLRVQWCQTVVPPSIHPSGNPYRFLQDGLITQVANLNDLIEWLNQLAPPSIKELVTPKKPIQPAQGNDLLTAVKEAWPTVLSVFAHFGMAAEVKQEHDGELRLLGNGGLLLTSDCSQFYCFSDQFGGGIFEAWGLCRVGSAYDKHKHFRHVLIEMAEAAGIEVKKPRTAAELLPFEIPASQSIVIVGGEDKARVLRNAGFDVVGLPGNIFKRAWARLFSRDSIVYIVLDPGKERQAEAIAGVFNASGIKALACQLPVRVDDMLVKYGGTASDLSQFLALGKKA